MFNSWSTKWENQLKKANDLKSKWSRFKHYCFSCSKFAIDDIAGLRDVFQKSVEQAKKAIEKAAKLEKQVNLDFYFFY